MMQDLVDGASCMFDTLLLWIWSRLVEYSCTIAIYCAMICSMIWGGICIFRFLFGILKR